jgi:hypothetical protein
MNDFISIVKEMRNPVDYLKVCKEEKDILRKCILCKKFLSSNQWSVLLEGYIKDKFKIKKAEDGISGDGISPSGLKIEIKVSLGGLDGSVNFVQIRPDHKIDYYLFLVYNLFEDEIGGIYWFLCPAIRLYKLIPEFGGYAHGTISKLGKISNENLYNRNCEFALRPNPIKNKGCKSRELWDRIKLEFEVDEEDIFELI